MNALSDTFSFLNFLVFYRLCPLVTGHLSCMRKGDLLGHCAVVRFWPSTAAVRILKLPGMGLIQWPGQVLHSVSTPSVSYAFVEIFVPRSRKRFR